MAQFKIEIAKTLEIPYRDDLLLKVSGSIDETFVLNYQESFEGVHVLLVDDLVNTGATLEACAHRLLKVPGKKISIATIAVTH